jgi:tetratricopeptide (TPR) repeat protein
VREHARALAPGDSSLQARTARRRLFDYYLHTARAADRYLSRRTASGIPVAVARRPVAAPGIRSSLDAIAWLDAEHLNVYAAARYASLNGWPEHSIAIAPAMFAYLRDTGNWNEARELTGAALRSAEATGRRAAWPTLLYDAGSLQYLTLDFDAAAETSAEAIELARDAGDAIGEANARLRLVAVLAVRGQARESALQLDAAERLYQDQHDLLGQAFASLMRGIVQHQTGELIAAEQSISRALEDYRTLGVRMGEAEALGYLAGVQTATGRYEAAEAGLSEALDIHRQLGDRREEAGDLYYLGATQRETRKFALAAQTLGDALRLYRESGDSFGEAGVLNQLGRLEVEQARDNPMPAPDQERARTYLTTALDLYGGGVKSDVGQAEVLNNLARLALESGNTAEARAYLDRALARAGSAEPERARAFEGIGLCQLSDGERDQGLATLRQALKISRAVGSPYASRVEEIIKDS